jgi:hypothetical protein
MLGLIELDRVGPRQFKHDGEALAFVLHLADETRAARA